MSDLPLHRTVQDDEIDRLKARVAELEKDNAHQRERRNAARDCIKKIGDGSPWLLRKQAEAVEALAKRFQDAADKADRADEDESDTALTLIIAKSVALKEAYQLRQKADEIERAGGEK